MTTTSSAPTPAPATPPHAAPSARGVNFVLARDYVVRTYDEDLWKRALARLSPAHRQEWERPLLQVGTYDFAAFKAGVRAIADETGANSAAALAAMYEYIAENSLNSLYKVFFRLANPAFVIGNFPKLWARFFTVGEVIVPLAQRERAHLRFRVPPVFLDWLGPACLGYSTKAVKLAGGWDVAVKEVERRRLADDTWEVAYDVTWQEAR